MNEIEFTPFSQGFVRDTQIPQFLGLALYVRCLVKVSAHKLAENPDAHDLFGLSLMLADNC